MRPIFGHFKNFFCHFLHVDLRKIHMSPERSQDFFRGKLNKKFPYQVGELPGFEELSPSQVSQGPELPPNVRANVFFQFGIHCLGETDIMEIDFSFSSTLTLSNWVFLGNVKTLVIMNSKCFSLTSIGSPRGAANICRPSRYRIELRLWLFSSLTNIESLDGSWFCCVEINLHFI